MNSIFGTNEFALQVISTGSFLDHDPGFGGKVYLVETAVVRLNHVAMNEWVSASVMNCRETYETDQEWKDYLAMKEARKNLFNEKVALFLGFDMAAESVHITKAVSEVFAVVHIHKVA